MEDDIQYSVCGDCGHRWVTGKDGSHSCARILKVKIEALTTAAELAEQALSAASRDIHEHLQVAIYNLRGEGRDGFKYSKAPNPPVLIHDRGIQRSEEVEKQCDKAWLATRRALGR